MAKSKVIKEVVKELVEESKCEEAADDKGFPFQEVAIKDLELDAEDRSKEELFDVDGLAANIKAVGLLTPIVVTKQADSKKLKVVAGKRRVMAFRKLKREAIPATIIEVDEKNLPVAIISDNFFNQPPEPIRQARIFAKLLDDKIFSSQNEMSKKIGIDQSLISRRLKLLELGEDIQRDVEEGKITKDQVIKVVGKRGGGELKKLPASKLQEELDSMKLLALPKEALLPSDGSSERVALKVHVGVDEVRIQAILYLKDIAKIGLVETIAREIARVGAKELEASITKFQKQSFSK